MKPTLLVLAAGIGSRYGGLKQIDPLGPHGELIIDYSIYDALRAGFGKIAFVIRRDMEQAFKNAVASKFDERVEIVYAFQELSNVPAGFRIPTRRVKPWGTAHAVLSAAGVVREPFAVLNADDYYGPSAFRSMAAFLGEPRPEAEAPCYALIGFLLRNTLSDFGGVARAVCECDRDGMLLRVTEMLNVVRSGSGAANLNPDGSRTELTGGEWISMNMWGFTPQVFEQFQGEFNKFIAEHGHEEKAEFLTPRTIDALLAAKRAAVKVIPSRDSWFGVTYQEDRPIVRESLRKLISQGCYPAPLWGNGT